MPVVGETSDAGQYLDAGDYQGSVTDVSMGVCKSNSPFAEYILADEATGQIAKASFVFKLETDPNTGIVFLNRGNAGMFARFLKGLGLSPDECKGFDTDIESNHRRMIGRQCMFRVALDRDGKWHEAKAFWRPTDKPPVAKKPKSQSQAPAAYTPPHSPSDNEPEVPF